MTWLKYHRNTINGYNGHSVCFNRSASLLRYLHRVMNQTQVASPCCIYDTEQSTPVESPEPKPGDQSEASVKVTWSASTNQSWVSRAGASLRHIFRISHTNITISQTLQILGKHSVRDTRDSSFKHFAILANNDSNLQFVFISCWNNQCPGQWQMVQLKSPFLALHHDYFDDTLLTPRTWYTEQELKCNSIFLLISYRGSISGGPSINATETGYFLVFCDPSSLRHHWLGPSPGCQVARILSIFCELHFGARLVISKISVTKLRLVKCDTSRLKLRDSLSAENNATRKTLIWKCHSYVTSLESLSPPTSVNVITIHSAPAFIRDISVRE